MQRKDEVWKSAEITRDFLEGMRGAIPMAVEQIDVLLRVVAAAQPQLRTFLDLGCGDGILGQALLITYPTAKGVFLDFSEPMLAAAQTKLSAESARCRFVMHDYGLADWIEAVQQDAPFDAIVSGFSIHHQPDVRKQEIYQEIFNLLAPGGVFINVEHVASPTPWLEGLFDEVFIDSTQAFTERSGSSKTRADAARDYHERPHKEANLLTSVELQCDWLREIGFAHVDCYLKLFELAVFGGIAPTS